MIATISRPTNCLLCPAHTTTANGRGRLHWCVVAPATAEETACLARLWCESDVVKIEPPEACPRKERG